MNERQQGRREELPPELTPVPLEIPAPEPVALAGEERSRQAA
jgi:hypothetical protein